MFLRKLLPKLSVCPYCNTIYRYGDVRKLIYKKNENCYHCGKKFKVSKKRLLVLLLEAAILYAATDLLLICTVSKLSLEALFIINVILAAIGILLIPFYTDFKKA